MSYTLYGIPNCDTVKKAKNWLTQHEIEFEFHNYKTDNISASKIKSWLEHAPLNKVLNKASTTFRNLSDTEKSLISDVNQAIKLMQSQPSMIKRPVLEKDGKFLAVGFKPHDYEAVFSEID